MPMDNLNQSSFETPPRESKRACTNTPPTVQVVRRKNVNMEIGKAVNKAFSTVATCTSPKISPSCGGSPSPGSASDAFPDRRHGSLSSSPITLLDPPPPFFSLDLGPPIPRSLPIGLGMPAPAKDTKDDALDKGIAPAPVKSKDGLEAEAKEELMPAPAKDIKDDVLDKGIAPAPVKSKDDLEAEAKEELIFRTNGAVIINGAMHEQDPEAVQSHALRIINTQNGKVRSLGLAKNGVLTSYGCSSPQVDSSRGLTYRGRRHHWRMYALRSVFPDLKGPGPVYILCLDIPFDTNDCLHDACDARDMRHFR
jgi:hypothetical protein